jgi:hypothetical protein
LAKENLLFFEEPGMTPGKAFKYLLSQDETFLTSGEVCIKFAFRGKKSCREKVGTYPWPRTTQKTGPK